MEVKNVVLVIIRLITQYLVYISLYLVMNLKYRSKIHKLEYRENPFSNG
jgi:hypothetical protein